MQVWGLKSFLDDYDGKIISYFQSVFRDLSMCSSCLLAVFQAITISPNSPRWAELKARASKYVILCCVFCWIFNLLVDITVVVYIAGPKNSSKGRWNIGYSSLDIYDMNTIKIVILKSVYEGVLVGLMATASGYMMLVLCRHHQRVQHIHSSSLTHRGSPETRATKNILLLLSEPNQLLHSCSRHANSSSVCVCETINLETVPTGTRNPLDSHEHARGGMAKNDYVMV
ncbi:vomeronasal type-1 receptor 3-like [Vombatus ursinus]|uniref:vomeronasal type-1 receptor 3-like n=1 Tax=Vombatus ursinus TaxID=29139 RepID=UPI000FFD1379|nr:vomeronasal type-1 receptor 3-like [Vombatus ursinus]